VAPRSVTWRRGGYRFHDRAGVSWPVLGVFLNHPHDQVRDAGGNRQFGPHAIDRRGHFLHLLQGDFDPAAFKGPAAGQHFIEDDSQRIDVGLRQVGLPGDSLRGHVVQRRHPLRRQIRVGEFGDGPFHPIEAEIQNLGLLGLLMPRQQDVLRLDVAMHHAQALAGM